MKIFIAAFFFCGGKRLETTKMYTKKECLNNDAVIQQNIMQLSKQCGSSAYTDVANLQVLRHGARMLSKPCFVMNK